MSAIENSNKPVDVATKQKTAETIQVLERAPEAVLLDMISESHKEEAKSLIRAMVVMYEESFSGPISPPSVLKQYEEIQPGSVDRILKVSFSRLKNESMP